jgi:hypothetical protein
VSVLAIVTKVTPSLPFKIKYLPLNRIATQTVDIVNVDHFKAVVTMVALVVGLTNHRQIIY